MMPEGPGRGLPFEPWPAEDAEEVRKNIARMRKHMRAPDKQEETPRLDRIIELLEKQVELLQYLVAADAMASEQNARVLDLLSGSDEKGAIDAFMSQRLMGGEGGRRR